MFQRRKKLIDKKFQLRTIFSIMGITMLFFLVMMAIVGISITVNNREISLTIAELNKAIKNEMNIVNAFKRFQKKISNSDYLIASTKITEDHKKSINVRKKYLLLLKNFAGQNFFFVSIIIGIVFVQGIVLFFYLIKLTHRISGPIYVISSYVQEIIDGKDPELRKLREKDEFKELYEGFIKMAEMISQEKR